MEKSWKIGGMLLPKCYPWFVFLFCWREWDLLTQSWLLEIAENGAGAVVYNRLGSCLARIWPWLDPQHPMWSPKPAGMIPVHRDKSKSWALLVWPKNTTNKQNRNCRDHLDIEYGSSEKIMVTSSNPWCPSVPRTQFLWSPLQKTISGHSTAGCGWALHQRISPGNTAISKTEAHHRQGLHPVVSLYVGHAVHEIHRRVNLGVHCGKWAPQQKMEEHSSNQRKSKGYWGDSEADFIETSGAWIAFKSKH